MSTDNKKSWSGFPEVWVVSTLMVAGILVRVFAAWRYRHTTNLDAGVVALMAKHISEGRHFPTFFYGQPHMGSLEAILSAGFCRIFGVSGFSVNVGTAFLSIAIIPIVYYWARNASGKRAAFLAAAFCVIGPHGFFHYNGSPRGGYAAALVFGACVVFLSTRMAIRWFEKNEQRHMDFFWLGIVAGLGWWSNQLITASLLAAALLLLLALKLQTFSLRLVTGFAGFLLGGLPFWIYNVRHEMASFRMADGLGSHSVLLGLRNLVLGRIHLLLLSDMLVPYGEWLVGLIYLGILGGGVWYFAFALRHNSLREKWTFLGIFLYTVLFSILFTQSHLSLQPTPRYLLPMIAPLGVWIGVVLSKLDLRVAVPLLTVLILCPSGYLWDSSFEKSSGRWYQATLQAGAEIENMGINTVYAPIGYRSWNFILKESVAVVTLGGSVFPGLSAQAELDPEIGVLADAGSISSFMTRMGLKGRHSHVAGFSLVTDVHGLPLPAPMEPAAISSVRDHKGQDWLTQLTDRDVSTTFRTKMVEEWEDLFISLDQPQSVQGVRFWPGKYNEVPESVVIFARKGNEEKWKKVSAASPWTSFFWSDQRMYWGEPFFRYQIRFPEVEADQLRIRFRRRGEGYQVSISQLDLLYSGQTEELLPLEWDQLFHFLGKENITTLLADRGESARVHRETDGKIKTMLPEDMFPDALPISTQDLLIPAHGAILVHQSQASRIRSQLEAIQDQLREHRVGGAVLWIADEEVTLPGRFWVGCDIWEHPARLGEWYWHEGEKDIALEKHPYWASPQPLATPAEVRFKNGIGFAGLAELPRQVQPGETLTCTSYWKLPDGEFPEVRNLAMFAHWRSETEMFTSDAALLYDVHDVFLEVRPPHGLYPMSVKFTVPKEMPPGTYELWMGLYRPSTGDRVKPLTSLPQKDDAVHLPVSLHVRP